MWSSQADHTNPSRDSSGNGQDTFVIEALLLAGDEEWLDLVLSPYHLRIARDGVVEAAEVAPPPELDTSQAVAVRLRLRAGTRLQILSSAQGIEESLWVRRSSFPVATRPSEAAFKPQLPAIVARTNEFLAAFGIDPLEAL